MATAMAAYESRSYKVGRAIILTFFCILFIFPFYWMLLTSFRDRAETLKYPPDFYPTRITSEGYERVWNQLGIPAFYKNTIIINIAAALLAMGIAVPGAYVCSRHNFWQKDNLLFNVLSIRFFPPATAIVPIFLLWKFFGLIDTKLGMIIIYAGFNIPIVLWVVKSFFDEIPREMEESYMLDGHSRLSAFFRVILPLGAPGLASVFMICIFLTFGEFLFAAVLTFSQNAQTLPYGAALLQGDIGVLWEQLGAAGVLACIPVALIIVFFQRYLVRGFSFGILK
jgi:multiple sugar transport system permease protein